MRKRNLVHAPQSILGTGVKHLERRGMLGGSAIVINNQYPCAGADSMVNVPISIAGHCKLARLRFEVRVGPSRMPVGRKDHSLRFGSFARRVASNLVPTRYSHAAF